jgi:indolepyruvate ferredoxin oxidoreductase
MTFKILYNATVAMTGGQDITGLMEVPALTRALAAEGVRQIVVCAEDPRRYGRRAERALITEFEKLIEDAVAARDDAGMPQEDLVRLAGSVMSIKGYGPVKEAAIARWRAEAARLRETVPA